MKPAQKLPASGERTGLWKPGAPLVPLQEPMCFLFSLSQIEWRFHTRIGSSHLEHYVGKDSGVAGGLPRTIF